MAGHEEARLKPEETRRVFRAEGQTTAEAQPRTEATNEQLADLAFAFARLPRNLLFLNMVTRGAYEFDENNFTAPQLNQLFHAMQNQHVDPNTDTRKFVKPLAAIGILKQDKQSAPSRRNAGREIDVYMLDIKSQRATSQELANLEQQIAVAGAVLILAEKLGQSPAEFIGNTRVAAKNSLAVIHTIAEEIRARRKRLGPYAELGEIDGSFISKTSGINSSWQVAQRLASVGLFQRREREGGQQTRVDYALPVQDAYQEEYPPYPASQEKRKNALQNIYDYLKQHAGQYFTAQEIYDYLKSVNKAEEDLAEESRIERFIQPVLGEWTNAGYIKKRDKSGIQLSRIQEDNILLIDNLFEGVRVGNPEVMQDALAKANEYAIFQEDDIVKKDIKQRKIARLLGRRHQRSLEDEETIDNADPLLQEIIQVAASFDSKWREEDILEALRQRANSNINRSAVYTCLDQLVAQGRLSVFQEEYLLTDDNLENNRFLAELLTHATTTSPISPLIARRFLGNAIREGGIFTTKGDVVGIFDPIANKYDLLTNDPQVLERLYAALPHLQQTGSAIALDNLEAPTFIMVKSVLERAIIRAANSNEDLQQVTSVLHKALLHAISRSYASLGGEIAQDLITLDADAMMVGTLWREESIKTVAINTRTVFDRATSSDGAILFGISTNTTTYKDGTYETTIAMPRLLAVNSFEELVTTLEQHWRQLGLTQKKLKEILSTLQDNTVKGASGYSKGLMDGAQRSANNQETMMYIVNTQKTHPTARRITMRNDIPILLNLDGSEPKSAGILQQFLKAAYEAVSR